MNDIHWHAVLEEYVHTNEPPVELTTHDVLAAVRRSRRRTRLAALTTTSAMAVLAAGILVATGQITAGHRAPVATSQAPALDPAYVKASMVSALADTSGRLARARVTTSGQGHAEYIFDVQTGRARYDTYRDGTLVQSTITTPAGSHKATWFTVDYTQQTWSKMDVRIDDPRRMKLTPLVDPADIRAALADGTLATIGHEQTAGHDTLHLRLTSPATDQHTMTAEIWVAPNTYLLTQSQIKLGTSDTDALTIAYSWPARTPHSLAPLDLTPPAGFTHTRN